MTISILDVKGIGQATAVNLAGHGIRSVSDLADASIDAISLVPGFSVTRATLIRAEARRLLQEDGASGSTTALVDIPKPSAAGKKKKKSSAKSDDKSAKKAARSKKKASGSKKKASAKKKTSAKRGAKDSKKKSKKTAGDGKSGKSRKKKSLV